MSNDEAVREQYCELRRYAGMIGHASQAGAPVPPIWRQELAARATPEAVLELVRELEALEARLDAHRAGASDAPWVARPAGEGQVVCVGTGEGQVVSHTRQR